MAFGLSDQSLANLRCLYVCALPVLSNPAALSAYLSLSGRTAKPSVKYAERITTSPQPVADGFSVQRSPSHHTTDNDLDNDGYHSPSHSAPQRSFTEPQYRRSRYTGAQSTRRRMTYGGWGARAENPATTNEKSISTTSLAQTIRTKVSTLFKPGHKVGRSPGFFRELRTIILGSCASSRPICF